MDNSTTFCDQIEQKAFMVGQSTRGFLVSAYITVGIVGLLANSLVIYVIKKCRNQTQSLRLIVYLSMVDIYSSVVLNLTYTIYLMYPGQLPCTAVKIIYGLSRSAIYGTAFLAVLTGIDRCLHILYMENYSIAYSTIRFRFSLLGYFALVLVQTFLTSILNTTNGLGFAGRYTAPVNILVVLLNIVLYLISIKVLRGHKKQNKQLTIRTRRITKIASVYFALFLAFQGILGLYQVMFIRYMRGKLDENLINIISYLIYYLPTLSGICNSFVFLKISRLLQRRIGMMSRGRRVTFSDSGANIPNASNGSQRKLDKTV